MITKELAVKALSKLTTPTAYEYFFENLKSAEWINPLKQARPDIFKKPIQAIRTDQGWSLPWWPESRYLARVADQAPNEIVNIILEMDSTDNTRIHDDFAEATLKLPLKDARKIVPKLLSWLDSDLLSFLPEKCAELAVKFAEARDCEMAVQLISKVLDLKAIPFSGDPNTPFKKDKVSTRYFDYHYQEILRNVLPRIVTSCGLAAIGVLDEKLLFALKTEGDLSDIENDHTYIWRPAIEDHGQNYPDSLKDHLVDALRDSYSSHINIHPGDAAGIVSGLIQSTSALHLRLGLHLLGSDHLKASPLLMQTFADKRFYEETTTWHEFSHLLRARIGDLTQEDRDSVLETIKSLKADKPGEEESERYCRLKKYRVYSMIPDHLIGGTKNDFETFRVEFGEMDHPDFHSYSSGTWVGPTSPIDGAELEKKSSVELIAFLRSWEPPKEWFSPSREGLGRTLESVVKRNPDLILSDHKSLLGLNPTYLRSIIQALRDTDKVFSWDIVLDLCLWIASQGPSVAAKAGEDEDPGFRWAKAAVVRLLTRGFESNSLPLNLRAKAWTVLHPITSDPDPDAAHEDKYLKGDSDYYQYSINTTRGEALHSVVAYALWLKRQEKIPDTESVFQRAPEVEETLTSHLDLKVDAQVGMRAVYGRWLPWLVLMDGNWVSKNLEKIFPRQPELSQYRESAWNTYILFCGAYRNVFELISDEYLFEISRIPEQSKTENKSRSSDPISRLGEHLMVLYWQGVLGEPETSKHLQEFFRLAPLKSRENTVNFIGRSLRNVKKENLPHAISDRLVKFWCWRKSGDLKTVSDELSEFGWWAISDKFDPDWMLNELEWVIRTTEWIEPDSLLFDSLRQHSATHAKLLIAITRAFIDGPIKKGKVWLMKERFMEFLKALRQDLNPEQRKAFIDLVDSLAAAGYLEFRPLAKF